MIEIPRSTFKTDPSYAPLYKMALKLFEVPKKAVKIVEDNRHIKGTFVNARQYFIIAVPDTEQVYVRCDAEVWWQDNKICATIHTIALYGSLVEYESARMKDLQSAEDADIPNLN